jgi:radical SAM superfamily enzyme YgiQ (UPF0313 family)
MKITLVHPPMTVNDLKCMPQVQPPLGLGYIAATLRREGHTVCVVDGVGEGIGRHTAFREGSWIYGLPIDEIVDRIDADTEVLGVGIMFSNFWPVSRELIRALRARFPRAVIVCGGEHVTALPDFVLDEAPIDYAVLGEGEETLSELLAHLANAPGSLPLDEIAGVSWRTADGAVARTRRRQRRRALDQIPWPAWDLFPIERYLETGLFATMAFESTGRSMVILGTRGCPYTCKFCSNEQMWGINFFMRDPKDIVDEMEFYMRTYGATDFHFQDLTLIINRRWAHQLCDEILRRNLAITWKTTSGTRSEALDLELLKKIAASGCDELTLAPESGSAEITKVTRKRVQLEKVLTLARLARDHALPMQVKANMIIGYPEERLRDVLRTFAYIVRMARGGFSYASIHRFTAYPGCEYHDAAVQAGKITHSDDYFLSLCMDFPFNRVSWHPRWSGGFIFLLVTLGYCLFFGAYYLSRPVYALSALWGVLSRRPQSRLERYLAYRLWGESGTRRQSAAPAA